MAIHLKPLEIVLLVAFGLTSLIVLLLCISCSGVASATKKKHLEQLRKERGLPPAKDPRSVAERLAGGPAPQAAERDRRRSATEPGRQPSKSSTNDRRLGERSMTMGAATMKAARMAAATAELEQVPLPPNVPEPSTPRQLSPALDPLDEEAPAPLRSEQLPGAAGQTTAAAQGRRASKAATTTAAGLVSSMASLGHLMDGRPWMSEDDGFRGRGSPHQAPDLGSTQKSLKSWVPTTYGVQEVPCVAVEEPGAAAFPAHGDRPALRRASTTGALRQAFPGSRPGSREAVDALYPDPARELSKQSTATEISII